MFFYQVLIIWLIILPFLNRFLIIFIIIFIIILIIFCTFIFLGTILDCWYSVA